LRRSLKFTSLTGILASPLHHQFIHREFADTQLLNPATDQPKPADPNAPTASTPWTVFTRMCGFSQPPRRVGGLGVFAEQPSLSVKAVSFVTTDSPEHVLEFYRKPLAKLGEVLECDHGKPVGSSTVTKSGVTCGDRKIRHMTVMEATAIMNCGRGLRSSSGS
jgi:hypothetical protein